MKLPQHETDHWHPSDARLYGTILPLSIVLMGCCSIKHMEYLTVTLLHVFILCGTSFCTMSDLNYTPVCHITGQYCRMFSWLWCAVHQPEPLSLNDNLRSHINIEIGRQGTKVAEACFARHFWILYYSIVDVSMRQHVEDEVRLWIGVCLWCDLQIWTYANRCSLPACLFFTGLLAILLDHIILCRIHIQIMRCDMRNTIPCWSCVCIVYTIFSCVM